MGELGPVCLAGARHHARRHACKHVVAKHEVVKQGDARMTSLLLSLMHRIEATGDSAAPPPEPMSEADAAIIDAFAHRLRTTAED